MCVQLLLTGYDIAVWIEWVAPTRNRQIASAEAVRRFLDIGSALKVHEVQGLPFAVSLASLREQSFQSLLTIDQFDQQQYVRKLLWCLGPIA